MNSKEQGRERDTEKRRSMSMVSLPQEKARLKDTRLSSEKL